MARFMVSMPDEIVKKLDRCARQERRTRSELLREAVKRHLSASAPVELREKPVPGRNGKDRTRKKWTKKALEEHLIEKGAARRGCLGLHSVVGRIKAPVDMKRVLRITKKLTAMSRQIIEDREDRV